MIDLKSPQVQKRAAKEWFILLGALVLGLLFLLIFGGTGFLIILIIYLLYIAFRISLWSLKALGKEKFISDAKLWFFEKFYVFIKKLFIIISVILLYTINLILLIEDIHRYYHMNTTEKQCDRLFCFSTETNVTKISTGISKPVETDWYYCSKHDPPSNDNLVNSVHALVFVFSLTVVIPTIVGFIYYCIRCCIIFINSFIRKLIHK